MLKYQKKKRFTKGRNIPFSLLVILEVAAIVIGVMHGFMLNEYRESRKNMETVNNALTNIANELSFNHDALENTYYYHKFILAQIDSFNSTNPDAVLSMYGYQLNGWQGVQTPMIRSSAYQVAITTGAVSDMSFETVNNLSQLFTYQSYLEKLDDAVIVRFTTDHGFTALQTLHHLYSLYTEMIPGLLAGYHTTGIETLERYGFNPELREGELVDAVEAAKEWMK
jgi:hypothetical protein